MVLFYFIKNKFKMTTNNFSKYYYSINYLTTVILIVIIFFYTNSKYLLNIFNELKFIEF